MSSQLPSLQDSHLGPIEQAGHNAELLGVWEAKSTLVQLHMYVHTRHKYHSDAAVPVRHTSPRARTLISRVSREKYICKLRLSSATIL
jgi:hypothetical protein